MSLEWRSPVGGNEHYLFDGDERLLVYDGLTGRVLLVADNGRRICVGHVDGWPAIDNLARILQATADKLPAESTNGFNIDMSNTDIAEQAAQTAVQICYRWSCQASVVCDRATTTTIVVIVLGRRCR